MEHPINLRASWLTRQVVRGNALLTRIRVRANEWRLPCMRWGSFGLELYEVGLSLLVPRICLRFATVMPVTDMATQTPVATDLCIQKRAP